MWLMWLRWLVGLIMLVLLVLLVRRILVMVWPLPILRELPLNLADIFSWTIKADGKGVGFNHQLSFHLASQLRKIPDYILLSLHSLLILVCPIRHLLWGCKEGMEKPKVPPGYPCRTRFLERCAEDATIEGKSAKEWLPSFENTHLCRIS
jgi:hypothetical protein